jgi:hypothetical protein
MSNPDQYIIPSPEKIVSHNYAKDATSSIQIILHEKKCMKISPKNINLILRIWEKNINFQAL